MLFLFSRITLSALIVGAVCFCEVATAAEPPSGEAIYNAKCVKCHGVNGVGSAKYKHQLEGDLSVAQLADLVQQTMPSEKPGSLTAAEAEAVAGYVHGAFYSILARERNRPARIELSRLTAKQLRNSLTDLIASFRANPATIGTERGFRGEYFSSRRFDQKSRALERNDPVIQFTFGMEPPVKEIGDAKEFSIRWNGSLIAPETGEYTFVVRTEHATRLYVNDFRENQAVIDAYVKSGNDNEYQGRMFLIAGHLYPVRLEFSKAKQGVKDNKEEPAPKPASIALLWKRPQGVLETVPAHRVIPNGSPESYICSTTLPPDDRSYGWERGTSVSKAWDQATTEAALETATYVADRLNELSASKEDDGDRAAKLRKFCRTFVERAFRRPLSDEQAASLIERQFSRVADPVAAVRRVVLLTLKSPRFLYREVEAQSDAYDVAARLSFGLWDSLPDRELFKAAAEGKLSNPDQIAQQSQRMLNSPRTRAKLLGFLLTWLKADETLDLAKDPEKFPGFNAEIISDLRASLELTLDDIVWSKESDFRQLLMTDSVFMNDRLAKFYGAQFPEGANGFVKVAWETDRRGGVLTHPYLMATFAHAKESSPIHRGVFLARGVLGQSLRPPAEAVAPLAPDLNPGLTTRERVALQTSANACMTCHRIINPLGFTLEHFDAVGRYREQDREKSVDSTGGYLTATGKKLKIDGARELANFIATSDEAQSAFVEQLFHHLVQQPIRAYGANTEEDLAKKFAADQFQMRNLAVKILVTSAGRGREKHLAESKVSAPKP